MTLRVDKALRDKFKAACAYRGKSVNSAIAEYMAHEVEKWESEMAYPNPPRKPPHSTA